MPTAAEMEVGIAQKRGELKKLFDDHKDAKGAYTHTQEQIDEINRRNDELGGLVDDYQKARGLEAIEEKNRKAAEFEGTPVRPPFAGGDPQEGKGGESALQSLGHAFTESKNYKTAKAAGSSFCVIDVDGLTLKNLPVGSNEVEQKATFDRGTGFVPFVPRIPRVILSAQRRPVVADLIPQDNISYASVKFMEETTFTNAAASVAEAGLKPEATLAFTERTQPVEKIAVWLPITEETMADAPQIRAVIDNRLTLMVMLTEETELLGGTGSSPHLQGFYTKSGIQTQAKGTDPVPDAVFKAITKVRYTGFADPTGYVTHPNDWQDVRLLRTADGLYIWGSPADAGSERIWGLPVVVTPAATENTGLVGDFQMFSQIFRREGLRLEVSNSHDTFFIYNKLAIRLEERLVLLIYRAAAFATVTGI